MGNSGVGRVLRGARLPWGHLGHFRAEHRVGVLRRRKRVHRRSWQPCKNHKNANMYQWRRYANQGGGASPQHADWSLLTTGKAAGLPYKHILILCKRVMQMSSPPPPPSTQLENGVIALPPPRGDILIVGDNKKWRKWVLRRTFIETKNWRKEETFNKKKMEIFHFHGGGNCDRK